MNSIQTTHSKLPWLFAALAIIGMCLLFATKGHSEPVPDTSPRPSPHFANAERENAAAAAGQPALVNFRDVNYCAAQREEAPDNFRKGFALETFAVASALDLTGAVDIGGGIGATYFFTRGFGAGARALAWNTSDRVVDELDARLIARAPLWDRVAPYGYVEGTYNTLGVDFDDGAWGAGAGGGLDFALFDHVQLFGEAGLRVDTKGTGQFIGAAGLKLPF